MHNFTLVNADTDSVSICKSDMSFITPEERAAALIELNSILPSDIQFADDGYFETFGVIAAKNYILWDGKKLKVKGASIKATNKETYLKDFINATVQVLIIPNLTIEEIGPKIVELYNNTAKECLNTTDITRFCFKKSYTERVMKGEGTAELKARLALKHEIGVQQGDKFRMFYLPNTNLCLDKNFKGEYCKKTLLKKLYATAKIFDEILPIELFINYSLLTNYYQFTGEEKPKRVKKVKELI